jgi:hypothetical protein
MILILALGVVVAGVGITLFLLWLFVGLTEPDEDELIEKGMGRKTDD